MPTQQPPRTESQHRPTRCRGTAARYNQCPSSSSLCISAQQPRADFYLYASWPLEKPGIVFQGLHYFQGLDFFFFFLFCFHPALPRVIPRNVTSISACPRKQAQINHCYMCITGVVQGQTCWLWKTQPPLLSHSRTVRALQNHAPGMCK